MTITIRYYEHKENFDPDYDTETRMFFSGKTAAECMEQYRRFSWHHDCARYTPTEIINVED